ncbi:unnamed protein product [Adineta steineri]|uniref:Potassium channel domain-containing protein n=1 Tax=Adineta steineri TaxID=433720 RepID=A0A815Z1X9_9BILA|nr:unnamed protein product [Adineta steineri]CAF1577886.1 unnamed protein product [Adineta steineri]
MSLKTDLNCNRTLVLTKPPNLPVDQKPFAPEDINDPFQIQKKNIRTAALIVCTFTYLIIGACVFDALEDAPSIDRKRHFERKFAQFRLDHNMTNETFRQLADLIVNKTILRHKWQFYDSFYFSTVVLALIGYGHRTLITKRAKIFCILYAMLGIPMWLITFQSAGERLNSLLSYILSKIKQSLPSLMNLLVIRIVAFYSQERLLEKLREEEAASHAVLLKGDVICSTNINKQRSTTASLVSGRTPNQQQILIHSSQTSVCSCTCMETFSGWKQARKKRAKWKKQNREERNKTMRAYDSPNSVQISFAVRRCSV